VSVFRRCVDTRGARLFPGNFRGWPFPVKVAFFSASVMTRKASGFEPSVAREPTLDAAFDD